MGCSVEFYLVAKSSMVPKTPRLAINQKVVVLIIFFSNNDSIVVGKASCK